LFKAACETLLMSDQVSYTGFRICIGIVQPYDTGNANIRDLLFGSLHRKVDGKFVAR